MRSNGGVRDCPSSPYIEDSVGGCAVSAAFRHLAGSGQQPGHPGASATLREVLGAVQPLTKSVLQLREAARGDGRDGGDDNAGVDIRSDNGDCGGLGTERGGGSSAETGQEVDAEHDPGSGSLALDGGGAEASGSRGDS